MEITRQNSILAKRSTARAFVRSHLAGNHFLLVYFVQKSTVLTDLFSLFSPHRLLHLAIIHEATDHALQMIKLSHNHPFLNVQNHQRQVIISPDDSTSATRRSNQTHNGPLKSHSWLKHYFFGFLLRLRSTSRWSQSSPSWSRGSWRPAVTRGCRTTAGTRLSTSPAREAPSPASGSSPRTPSTTSPPSCPSPTTMVIIELQ